MYVNTACMSYKADINHEKGGNFMRSFKEFWKEEDGIGVVELILILGVLIGLVLNIKDSLRELVQNIFETITEGAADVSATD